MSETLTDRLPGPGMSALPALLLAVLGNILVIVFLAIMAVLTLVAGVAVFWPAIESVL